jgi:hypothetical protein
MINQYTGREYISSKGEYFKTIILKNLYKCLFLRRNSYANV